MLNCTQQGREWRVWRFSARWGEGCKLMQDLGRPLLLGKPQQQSSAEQCNTGIWSKPLDFDGKWKKVAKSNFEEGGCKIGWDYRGRGAGVVGGRIPCKLSGAKQSEQFKSCKSELFTIQCNACPPTVLIQLQCKRNWALGGKIKTAGLEESSLFYKSDVMLEIFPKRINVEELAALLYQTNHPNPKKLKDD